MKTRGSSASRGLLALACVALAGANASPQQSKGGQGIHVQTTLVNVLASVLDADGHPIPDLPKESFQILEEGVPQTIERFEAETNQPLELALMVDSSLSTLKE